MTIHAVTIETFSRAARLAERLTRHRVVSISLSPRVDPLTAVAMSRLVPSSCIDLDHNATTRPLPEVVDEIARVQRDVFANPGSRHAPGRRARRLLEQSRESIARILGAQPEEVIFTSGGTESINLALFGLAAGPPETILLTAGEHPATLEVCRQLERRGWRLLHLDVDADGLLRPHQLAELLWNEIRIASVILAHNETGVIQDVAPLAAHCRQHGIPLHLDAVQAVGKIPVDFQTLDASLLSLGAHKFHGPRGVGALLKRNGVELTPRTFGGHQENGLRPGTEPVALIAGMARALELWHADWQRRTDSIRSLRDRLQQGLEQCCSPVVVNGSEEHRLPNTLNISFPGLDGEALLVALDLENVCCSLGSTCASGSAEPAPALLAMGKSPEIARAALRFSVGLDNTPQEIDEAIRLIADLVKRLRPRSGGFQPPCIAVATEGQL